MNLPLHGKSRGHGRWQAFGLLLALMLSIGGGTVLGGGNAQASGTVVVKPSGMNGWYFWNDKNDIPTGSPGELVSGPVAPPAGAGSVQLGPLTNDGTGIAGAAGHSVIATNAYFGTKLVDITNLAYASYQSGPTLAVALQFDVRYRTTDLAYGGRLVFEPYQNGAVTVGPGWQSWSPLAGKWWATKTTAAGTGGAQVVALPAGNCAISSPCTWSQITAAFPDAAVYGRFLLKAGSGTGWVGFTGNADNLTIGVSGADTTYDFEPETPCTLVCYADATTGNDAFGGDTPASAKKHIQAAINQVTPTGTVHVAAGSYAENVVIPKAVTVQGAGASTIVVPAVSNPNCGGGGGGSLCSGGAIASNVFLVQANGVHIAQLTVDGENALLGVGIHARNGIITNHASSGFPGAGTFNNLEVDHVTVQNIHLRGIYASSGGSFNFHDNTVTNVQAEYASIAMFAYGGPGTMARNHVSSANDAISANHSSGIHFFDNVVTNSNSGVHTDNSGDGGGVADLIEGNAVSNCTPNGYGIWVFVPYIAPTVRNNTVIGCQVGLGAFGGGPGAPTASFVDNVVNGGGAVGSVGLLVQTGTFGYGNMNVKANFVRNTILNNATGVQVDESPDPYESPIAVAPTATAAVALHYNVIAGNTVAINSLTATPQDMENNWWGCSSGPSGGVCGTASGNADYNPWLVDRITAIPSVLPVGGTATVTADLTYNSNGVQPGDTVPNGTSVEFTTVGGGSVPPSLTGTIGGTATATLNAGAVADVFDVCAKVPAPYGAAECILFAVYDPTAGFVTGGGWINSPAGAYVPNSALAGKASFGFVSKYEKGKTVPSGNTQFEFKAAGMKFGSTSYDWLVISGARAQYKGLGTINGLGEYRFILTAIDGQVSGGGGIDRFRIKIWDKATEALVYDNQLNAPDTDDPATALGGGQIVIHK
jgi:hypothetical protein